MIDELNRIIGKFPLAHFQQFHFKHAMPVIACLSQVQESRMMTRVRLEQGTVDGITNGGVHTILGLPWGKGSRVRLFGAKHRRYYHLSQDVQFGASEDDSNRFILMQRNWSCEGFTTPKSKEYRRWGPFAHPSPSSTAFPVIKSGRLLHLVFRGLLSVHSRYGLHARRVAKATLSIEGFSSFVASTTASIATGWSEPVPGRDLHPLKSHAFSRRTLSPPIPIHAGRNLRENALFDKLW
jgi:hypothetical protein